MAADTSALDVMPTTAEMLHRAAGELKPLLSDNFYGRVILIYEKGKPVRVEVQQSYKI